MKMVYLVVTQGAYESVYHGAYEKLEQAELVSLDYEDSEVIETPLFAQ